MDGITISEHTRSVSITGYLNFYNVCVQQSVCAASGPPRLRVWRWPSRMLSVCSISWGDAAQARHALGLARG